MQSCVAEVSIQMYPQNEKHISVKNTLWILIALIVLHVSGIYLFASGFLLERLELPRFNTCSNITKGLSFSQLANLDKNFHSIDEFHSQSNLRSCSSNPRFKRAVLILIDALRFDFSKWDPSRNTSSSLNDQLNDKSSFYINKLPILNSLLQNFPSNSLLFRSRVDPPTTTLQRLKALTTGTLPTFVDAGSNFGGSVITEDNILSQLAFFNGRIVFMGDDTWQAVFPHSINESYPFPSLDVMDLHSVDNGVLEHLIPTITDSNRSRWDFLIAHFLGVDHCGHRWGPESIAMEEKLVQMNGVLENVFEAVDNDTLVIVLGDHGMDPRGNHGGESEPEINAAMFFYSKKKLWDSDSTTRKEFDNILRSMKFQNDVYEKANGRNPDSDPYLFMDGHRTIAQIDLVPTLSMLLNIPIPFGNLGSIIPEFFFVESSKSEMESDYDSSILNLVETSRANAQQIFRYLNEYTTARPASDFSLQALSAVLDSAETNYLAVVTNFDFKKTFSSEQRKVLLSSITQYNHFMRTALVAARRVWARFDVPLIISGVLVQFLCVVCSLAFVLKGWKIFKKTPFTIMFIGGTGSAISGALFRPFGILVLCLRLKGIDSDLSYVHEGVIAGTTVFMISYLVFIIKDELSNFIIREWFRSKNWGTSHTIWNLSLGVLLLILQSTAPFSDSFTIWEERTNVFLLATFSLLVLIRTFSWDSLLNLKSITCSTVILLFLSRLSLASSVCRLEMQSFCIPTNISSSFSLCLLYLLIPLSYFFANHRISRGIIISSIYWTLDEVERSGNLSSFFISCKIWFAKIMFPTIIIYTLWTFRDKNELLVILAMSISMFSKPLAAVELMSGCVQIFALINIGKRLLEREWEQKDTKIKEKSQKHTSISLLFLIGTAFSIISHSLFFATGHQFTLSSVQWDMAFIGLETIDTVISPILMQINTFGPLILTTVGFLVFAESQGTGSLTDIDSKEVVMLCGIIAPILSMCTSMSAGLLRRHLAVWSVFAPKWMFQTAMLLSIDVYLFIVLIIAFIIHK
ncbi:mannose-ethanolamine phosphotransferase gpi13 [Nowakowskiella sp. JEL0078]|nr:mannose-ethanolamine phosphotransferase gpi13 [Nowakowskiella sp. JEL0078]